MHLISCNPKGIIRIMGKETQKMPLRYKINILNALKEKGYNTNRIRTEGLFSQSTLQKLREGKGLSWENIERICGLLECQPGDLIEYVQENNWFPIHFSACSKSPKSAGYKPVSVQQMRDTLLRMGLYFGKKKLLLPGRALVWLGKFQMGFWFSNSADGKEKSDRLHLGSLSPFLLRKFFWTCIEQKRSKKYCVISALWISLSLLHRRLPWCLPEW